MFFKDFKTAISDYSQGMKLMSELKLWRFTLIPALIAIVLAILIIALAYFLAPSIGAYISDFWPFSFWEDAIDAISNFLGGVLIVIGGFMLFKHAVMAFSSPFMSPISEKIEAHLTQKETTFELNMATTLARSIRINLRNLGMELLLTLPLLILSLIPLLNLITAVLLFLLGAYYAGFGNLDYTLERHMKYKASKKFVQSNKGIACGNGTIFMLALLIPVIGIALILPLSTAASTISAVNKMTVKN
ncbi:MAG: EI24 domain-containing protein [Crocinitomicaceae bacterium]